MYDETMVDLVRAELARVRALVVRGKVQAEVFDWAADVIPEFVQGLIADELWEDFPDGDTQEAVARDLVRKEIDYRLGEQLQDLCEDQIGTPDERKARYEARVGHEIVARVNAL